jgi:hypothetical protein
MGEAVILSQQRRARRNLLQKLPLRRFFEKGEKNGCSMGGRLIRGQRI